MAEEREGGQWRFECSRGARGSPKTRDSVKREHEIVRKRWVSVLIM